MALSRGSKVISALILTAPLLMTACATTDEVKHAQDTANAAKATADQALSTAQQAMQAAQAASDKADKASSDVAALNQKTDQMFNKSLRK